MVRTRSLKCEGCWREEELALQRSVQSKPYVSGWLLPHSTALAFVSDTLHNSLHILTQSSQLLLRARAVWFRGLLLDPLWSEKGETPSSTRRLATAPIPQKIKLVHQFVPPMYNFELCEEVCFAEVVEGLCFCNLVVLDVQC